MRMASHVLNSAVLARPLAATRATRASRVAARCDPREDGVIVPNVRVAGVLAGAALALLPAARTERARGRTMCGWYRFHFGAEFPFLKTGSLWAQASLPAAHVPGSYAKCRWERRLPP